MTSNGGPLRVAFGIDSFDVGGTELNAVRLAEALDPQLVALSICHLQADGPLKSRYQALGLHLEHIRIPNLYSFATLHAASRFASWLRQSNIEVVHTHDLYTNIFAAPAARLGSSAAVIASRRWWYDAPRPGLVTLNRLSNLFAHRVLANSAGVARLLQTEEHVPVGKVLEIPNFLEERAFRLLPEQELKAQRQAWGVPPDAFTVGTVARLAPVKNQEMLLRAVARLGSTVHLVLVGDGPGRQSLEQLAAELGIGQRTHFLGQLVHPVNVHQFFDVSVLCSRSEGFPNAVIEALAVARPVVATRVGGVPDIVADQSTGLLVEVDDIAGLSAAIQRLMDVPELAALLGTNGREKVRCCYHQSRVVAKLTSTYIKMAGRVPEGYLPPCVE